MNTQAQAKVRFSSFFRSSMGRELFEDEKREKNGGETPKKDGGKCRVQCARGKGSRANLRRKTHPNASRDICARDAGLYRVERRFECPFLSSFLHPNFAVKDPRD